MLKNYLKIAFRNMKKNGIHTCINIAGLSVGMACCVFIMLYVRKELSFDRFHRDHDRIFRVILDIKGSSSSTKYAINIRPLAPALKEEIPEVIEAARIGGFYYKQLVKKAEKVFYEDGFVYADPEIFSVLTIPFTEGDPETALRAPHTVVFPERLAKKYFPNEQALGKTIRIGVTDYLITGVVKDGLANTHMVYDMFLPISDNSYLKGDWTSPGVLTYVKLAPDADVQLTQDKIRNFGAEHYRNNTKAEGKNFSHSLQPVTDVYLHSADLEGDICRRGNLTYLYIFAAIGLVVLTISCINFTNLTIARSATRAREVGVRKVFGAKRNELIKQFLTESGIMAVLAMLIAILIVIFFRSLFNSLVDTDLRFDVFNELGTLLGLLLMTLLVVLLAGGYPAILLTSFNLVRVLKGPMQSGSSGLALRKSLVIVQFAVSVVLSISTIIIYQQLQFMYNRNLGFRKEQKLAITIKGKIAFGLDWESLKNDFLQYHGISGAAGSTNFPGEGVKMMLRNMTRLVGEKNVQTQMMYYYFFDADFLDVYDMELAAGRGFAKDRPTDGATKCLINEKAVAAFGWSDPQEAIGKRVLVRQEKEKEIIGVVKDFHFRGVKYFIEPLIIENNSGWFEHMTLSLNSEDLEQTMDYINKTWKQRFPDNPLEYVFLDTIFAHLYQAEEQAKRLVTLFTGLGLFIACLGLLGLASYTTEQRTKEIGIRKTLGASTISIAGLLTQQYIKWIALANIIAWPTAYVVIHRWLQTFAYRTSPQIWMFILATGVSFLIAMLTIGYKSVKAASANPVEALRYE